MTEGKFEGGNIAYLEARRRQYEEELEEAAKERNKERIKTILLNLVSLGMADLDVGPSVTPMDLAHEDALKQGYELERRERSARYLAFVEASLPLVQEAADEIMQGGINSDTISKLEAKVQAIQLGQLVKKPGLN